MKRIKDILLIIFASLLGYQTFFKKTDTFEEENKALKKVEDSLLQANKRNQLVLDSLSLEIKRVDTIIIIKKQRQTRQAYEDHQKIIAIDSLTNDSIYKLLTSRYIR